MSISFTNSKRFVDSLTAYMMTWLPPADQQTTLHFSRVEICENADLAAQTINPILLGVSSPAHLLSIKRLKGSYGVQPTDPHIFT